LGDNASARRGLVQVYTGDGKGKTTAAIGAAVRALGDGQRVYIAFFFKGARPSGEREALKQFLNVKIESFGTPGFVHPERITDAQREAAVQGLNQARRAIYSGDYDMAVLDEINLAATWGLVSLDELLEIVKKKPAKTEIILTGRRADARLIEAADLVTEMHKVKHPYDEGVPARPGVEY